MEQQGNRDRERTSTGSFGATGSATGTGGPAGGAGSSFGARDPGSVATAADHQIPADTGQGRPASPSGGGTSSSGMSDRMEEVRTRADQGMKQAASQLDSLAQRLDSTTDQKLAGATGARARAGDLAHGLADAMESVAGYLRNNDTSSLQRDLERQVRERPVQTRLIGVAAGWVVGKILR